MNLRIFTPACLSLLAAISLNAADVGNTDKGPYSLINPVPKNLLRPLSSDEADKVAGPYTLDAGHFQVESDLINYSTYRSHSYFYDSTVSDSTHQFQWAPNVKVGLCDRADFEVRFSYSTWSGKFEERGYDSYVGYYSQAFKYSGSSFGSVIPKLKINLWGNDGGMTALAISPYIDIPTDGNYSTSGGAELPFAVRFPREFTLKITPGFRIYDDYAASFVDFSNNLSLTKAFTSQINVFAAISTDVSTESNTDWRGYLGYGGSYTFPCDIQLYAGMRWGLTDASAKYNPYLGVAWRF